MICQTCGIEAPTRYVSFQQNIGALIMRFAKTIEGNLCKRCLHKHFWECSLTTFFLGWWGTISLLLTPIFLLNNLFYYITRLGMEPVPPDAAAPELTDDAVLKIKPHAERLFDRLNANEPLADVAADISSRSGATPGQVILFVRAVIEAQQNQQQ